MFTRDDLLKIRELSPARYQGLMNYSGSRTEACATALLLRMGTLAPDAQQVMVDAVSSEIGTANCIAGLGFMLHGDRLHAPLPLKALTPLMVEGRLTNFPALKGALGFKVGGDDGLLHRYIGDWWNNFSVAAQPYPQGVSDIITFWERQAPTSGLGWPPDNQRQMLLHEDNARQGAKNLP
ncbi:hypothetical protein NMY22_g15322 [Coprinellus aureogranulatus]|nr:hypothetical protein NMY22_g15322 [Coprinellus aureogranulatus]